MKLRNAAVGTGVLSLAAFGAFLAVRGRGEGGDAAPTAERAIPLSTRDVAPEAEDRGARELLAEARARIARGDDSGETLLARVASEFPATLEAGDAEDELALRAVARGDAGPAERALREKPERARRPARIELALGTARRRMTEGDPAAAALLLTRQLGAMAVAEAPYAEMRGVADAVDVANREVVFHPARAWRSESVVVSKGDSWHSLAKKFAAARGVRHGVGLLRAVNRRSNDHLGVGESVRMPFDAVRIEVFRASFAAFVYLGDLVVRVYPIGVGREDSETPTGRFEIGKKDPRPIWWKPRPPIPYGDPKNPLGSRWLGFRVDGKDIPYGIHGTDRDDAVGARVSEGCIRLHNRDVEELFDLVPDTGTIVDVR